MATKPGRDAIIDKEPVVEREHEVSMAAVTVNLREASGDNDVNAHK